MTLIHVLLYLGLPLGVCAAVLLLLAAQSPRYPPGPRGIPLLGNVNDMPQKDACKTYLRWAKDYGDIMHLNLAGKHMIILNTVKAARDILEKRAENYSSRPYSVMSHELLGMGWSLTIQNGEAHKRRRALVQKYFVGRVASWQAAQCVARDALIKRITDSPLAFYQHIDRYASDIVLKIGYGYDLQEEDDKLLSVIKNALDYSARGPYIVDWIPSLKYLPEWFPLIEFHRDAKVGRSWCDQMRDIPFNIVADQMSQAKATAQPSFVSSLLNELADGDYNSPEAQMIRDCAGVMYGAASDSTAASMHSFVAAMTLYPEVQQRAQLELDSILGKGRLASFADRQDLPYNDALVLEVLRWNVVTPLGIPHASVRNDTYMGYEIPGQSMVTGNLWAIFRDPAMFPDPERFDPSRFIGNAEAREVMTMAFGWGRRVCPGRQVADASLFIATSSFLASFSIHRPRDRDGKLFVPEIAWSEGFVRRPLPFPCVVEARK